MARLGALLNEVVMKPTSQKLKELPVRVANQRALDDIISEVVELEADSEMLILLYEADSNKFIALTMEVDEHPEDYGRACLCKTCQSYGE